ncbi:MAG: hypothetical protein MJE66_00770 [Proteobacteria bacterium]|nr:hypothetical protein [Pseudomonadota bacterium]
MAEGFFAVLTTASQRDHIDRFSSFLSRHVASEIQSRQIGGEVLELRSESTLDFPADEFVELCQSLLQGDEWVRVFACDEYGTEEFWFISADSKWRIATEQDFPNARTLKAYRLWHRGLGSVSYGAIDEGELASLEEKYGIFDAAGRPLDEPSPPLREQVGTSVDFIGRGVAVPHAGKFWDWYIPDHECLAVEIAKTSDFPPEHGKIRFERTFLVDGDVGYAWSWIFGETEIFLLFLYSGEDGYYQRLVNNTMQISLDEAILLAYYAVESSEEIEIPEGWITSPASDEYLHNSLENIDCGPFDAPGYVHVFDGRVMSPHYAVIERRGGRLYLTESHGAEPDEPRLALDAALDSKIREELPQIHASLDGGVGVEAKLRMKSRDEVSEVLAARFVEFDERDQRRLIGELPLRIEPESEI